jgi:hypothetical protein
VVESSLEVGGKNYQGDRQPSQQQHQNKDKQSIQCYRCEKMGHTTSFCRTHWEKIHYKKEKNQDKNKQPPEKGNPPESVHYVVVHCNLDIGEVFSTSFSSWNDTRLLDTGATCHMTFIKYFFETFNDQIDGVVYFADKSQLKPSGIGSVRLKLPIYVDYILHDILYLPQLKRNVLSLIHIRKQGPFNSCV